MVAVGASAAGATEFAPGELVEEVVSVVDPEHSYALYLPSNFSSDRSWPILYLFEARRRGAEFARRHQQAAERLGWILASSNNSESDGDFEPNRRAMIAMWEDTHSRFPIDPRRRYAGGFSGGARVAAILAFTRKGEVAGVLGWGAGLPLQFRPVESRPPFHFFGGVGDADFNYSELDELATQLEAVGAKHHVAVFDGAHVWPPIEVATQAMTWMEMQAMRQGLRDNDAGLVAEVVAAATARAASLEDAGDLLAAATELRSLAELVAGFHDTLPIEESIARLEGSDSWGALEERREEALAWESRTFERIKQAFNATAKDAPVRLDLSEVLQIVDVDGLRRLSETGEPREKALAARRMLSRLAGQTAFMLPQLMTRQGDHERALLMLEVGVRVVPDSARTWAELGRTALRTGDSHRAMDALEKALDLGWEGRSELELDPLWEPIRGTARFAALLAGGG